MNWTRNKEISVPTVLAKEESPLHSDPRACRRVYREELMKEDYPQLPVRQNVLFILYLVLENCSIKSQVLSYGASQNPSIKEIMRVFMIKWRSGEGLVSPQVTFCAVIWIWVRRDEGRYGRVETS